MCDGEWRAWDPGAKQSEFFVHDRRTQTAVLASVATDGRQAWGANWDPSISAGGRFVAFWTQGPLAGDETKPLYADVYCRICGDRPRRSRHPFFRKGGTPRAAALFPAWLWWIKQLKDSVLDSRDEHAPGDRVDSYRVGLAHGRIVGKPSRYAIAHVVQGHAVRCR